MKLWFDDLRQPPDDSWTWAKTHYEASHAMEEMRISGEPFEALSLDHDLGGAGVESTTRSFLWGLILDRIWPNEIRVHSMNPVGREWLVGMIARYHPLRVERLDDGG